MHVVVGGLGRWASAHFDPRGCYKANELSRCRVTRWLYRVNLGPGFSCNKQQPHFCGKELMRATECICMCKHACELCTNKAALPRMGGDVWHSASVLTVVATVIKYWTHGQSSTNACVPHVCARASVCRPFSAYEWCTRNIQSIFIYFRWKCSYFELRTSVECTEFIECI